MIGKKVTGFLQVLGLFFCIVFTRMLLNACAGEKSLFSCKCSSLVPFGAFD